MKKYIGIIIGIVGLVSMGCPDPSLFKTYNSDFLYVSYRNSKGEDLLNPSTPGSYNYKDSIFCNPSSALIGPVQTNSANRLPSGYYYLSLSRKSEGDYVTNVNGVRSGVLLLSFGKNVKDTLTYTLGTTKTDLKYDITSIKYNQTLYLPPTSKSVFPAPAYITVAK